MKHRHQQPSRGRALWVFLAASATLNLAAAAWVLSLHFHDTSSNQSPDNLASAQAQLPSPAAKTASAPTAASRLSGQSTPLPKFHWKQVESESYEAYVARLRDIGCPDSTIKHILAGELKQVAATKRAELERKILHSTDWSPPRGVSRQDYLAAQLRKLDREIDVTASDLLTRSASSGSPGMAASQQQQQDNQSPVRYPAVLGDVSFEPGSSGEVRYAAPGIVEVPEEQLGSIRDIQDNFVQEIGGMNQDAEDPRYEQAWRTAEWKADQVFRARHGWAAYGDLQRAAAQKAYENEQKAAAGQ